MKILVVCQYYYPEPFRITDICESLVKRGHEVTVMTGLPNYPEGEILQEYRHGNKRKEKLNGVNVIRCYEIGRGKSKIELFLNYFSYAASATLKALIMEDQYDVILINQLSPVMMGIPAMVYKKKFKKKILFYCLDLWPDSLAAGGVKPDSIVYRLFYRISRWIYSSADLLLVTSSMFENYFREVLKLNEVKIKHLPQYAEDLFTVNLEHNSSNSEKNKAFNFVFAGNIGDMQSVETIIRAANELKDIKNISFHIIGDGSRLEDCKKLSDGLSISSIVFYGRRPVEEMPQYYAMADAMLITLKANKTLSLTLPGKVQSYMAAGKPIIGAIDGETQLVIEKASCGYTCDAENYKALAKLIKEFCISNEREQMGRNALNFYLENYSKERFMTVLENELINLEEKIDV